MELALEADVSTRHLSFVETGRSKPSREMVVRLAEHLDVPLRERNELLLAAGYAPAYPETPLEDAEMAAGPRRGPAAARRPRALSRRSPSTAAGSCVDGNAGVAADRPPASPPHLLEPPVNALRLSLHPEGMAPRIANLARVARHILGRLRREVAATAGPAAAPRCWPSWRPTPATAGAATAAPARRPARSSSRCGCATDAGELAFMSHHHDLRHAAGHHRLRAVDRGVLPGRRPHRRTSCARRSG